MNTTESPFESCIKITSRPDGWLRIECRLGLWSVEGYERTELEAYHYWMQYLEDGEYDKLLAAP